jgi:hypothetical protein
MGELLVIAGSSHPVAADFASHAARQGRHRVAVLSTPQVLRRIRGHVEKYSLERLSDAFALPSPDRGCAARVVVFLDSRGIDRQRPLIEALAAFAAEHRVGRVCVVSTFLVHLGDPEAEQAEAFALRQFEAAGVRLVVLRPGHVLSEHAPLSKLLRRFGAWFEVIPDRFGSCFVEGDDLFRVIDQVLADQGGSKMRTYTLLGPNRSWHSFARERQRSRMPRLAVFLFKGFLQWFPVEQALALVFGLLARRLPRLRAYSCDTLHPRSLPELLALYNPHNDAHVQIVGYNNGVTHFGHRYPGRTVVSTVCCTRPVRIKGDIAKLDAGTTFRAAGVALRSAGKEFHVLPNYSYVSVGTAFFIPIHGSASRFTTLGETIEKVVLYDPAKDRILTATRRQPEFGRYMYDLKARVILLRLYVRVKDKSTYRLRRQDLESPSSQEVLNLFHDEHASNVELRKASAASRAVQVCKYYEATSGEDPAGLEVPRDRLGSLWDRLEENSLTRVLFHGLTRRFAHHVELFLPEAEFAVFWDTHATLPIKKIQLRFIRQDGFPNSPFRKADCISADLFMLKKHRAAFEDYLKKTFGVVRMNPGKHSRV